MFELRVSAGRSVATGGTRGSDGGDSPRARDQTGSALAKHDRAADSHSRPRASPRRIPEDHTSRADRRARAGARRKARAIPGAGARRKCDRGSGVSPAPQSSLGITQKSGRAGLQLAGGGLAFFRLAGRKRARAFGPRPNVETIEKAEVRIADYFESPQQGQTQRPANCASDFLD